MSPLTVTAIADVDAELIGLRIQVDHHCSTAFAGSLIPAPPRKHCPPDL